MPELAVSLTTYHFENARKNMLAGITRKFTRTSLRSINAHFMNGAVMLSEALQRNAQHEARLSNISDQSDK